MFVSQRVEVVVSNEELIAELESRLGVKSWSLIDGNVYHYERTHWSEYENVLQPNPPKWVKPRLEALDAIKRELKIAKG